MKIKFQRAKTPEYRGPWKSSPWSWLDCLQDELGHAYSTILHRMR